MKYAGAKRVYKLISAAVSACLLLLTLGATGCSEPPIHKNEEMQKITVLLDWVPNTNHTGLFAARDQGYYREEGLEVEILHMSGVEQLVAAEKAHFGVSYQEAVTFARLEDLPVVSIAAVIQHNTSGFASFKEKGIETPADFEGKSYGGWGSPIEEATIKALMEKYGADYDKVEILTTGVVDFFTSSAQDADFSWIFYGWDGVAAEIKGIELNYIDLGRIDADLDYYTPILITGENLIDTNPELVEKFMQATAAGYEFAIEDPLTAAEILLANAPELDRELVIASQQWLQDKYRDEASAWGLQKKDVWERYARWLYRHDLIERVPDIEQIFTNDFLP